MCAVLIISKLSTITNLYRRGIMLVDTGLRSKSASQHYFDGFQLDIVWKATLTSSSKLLFLINPWKKLQGSFTVGFSSIHFSRSVVYDSLWPHGLQHARLPCPSPAPGACSNSCSLSQWCHPTISSSVVPFSSCLQSFPASQDLFQWVSSSHQVAKVLELQLHHRSFQWLFL